MIYCSTNWRPESLRGELGRKGELDAFSITRTDGSVIDIRPGEGPPPWAGGSNRARSNPSR